MPQYFNGKFFVQPQAVAMVDDTKLASVNPTAANTLALVGKSTGGVPQVPVLITDPNQARRVLRSGDLLDACLMAFNPGSTGGVSQIQVVRVNNAIKAKGKIFDIASPVKATQTVTIGGTPGTGNVITITYNGTALAYTLQAGDASTVTTAAAAVVTAINTSTLAAFTDPLSGCTAGNVSGVITLTARSAGTDNNSVTVTASSSAGATATAGGATMTGGTGNVLVYLTSNDYGLYCNSIYFTVGAASGGTGFKFTGGVTSGDVAGGSVFQDNIYRNLLTIQYTGAGSASTLTVNDTQLTTSCTGATADNVSILFSTFPTVQAVADYLTATGKYNVTVTSGAGSLASAGQFDPQSAIDIKTTSKNLTAHLQALIEFINTPSEPFISATRPTNPAVATPYYNTAAIFLTGGSDGSTTVADWTAAINSLQTVDAYVVVPLTDDASVHAATSTHVQYMSDSARSPRVAVVGGALGEYVSGGNNPVSTVVARAVALGSKRVTLCYPGMYLFDSKGNKVLKSSAFHAALFGAMACAVPQGTPLTHKSFNNVQGLEVNLTSSDKDALLMGGVACAEFTGKQYRVVQSKTTWNGAPNYGKNEFSTVAAIDAVIRRVQDALDTQLVGAPLDFATLQQSMSITETVLIGCANDGFIVGDPKNKAYKNIVATAEGDTIRIAFEISPVIPANFVLITAVATPWSGSIN